MPVELQCGRRYRVVSHYPDSAPLVEGDIVEIISDNPVAEHGSCLFVRTISLNPNNQLSGGAEYRESERAVGARWTLHAEHIASIATELSAPWEIHDAGTTANGITTEKNFSVFNVSKIKEQCFHVATFEGFVGLMNFIHDEVGHEPEDMFMRSKLNPVRAIYFVEGFFYDFMDALGKKMVDADAICATHVLWYFSNSDRYCAGTSVSTHACYNLFSAVMKQYEERDGWKHREVAREHYKLYKRISEENLPVDVYRAFKNDHVHMSVGTTNVIAFTPSSDWGFQDRQLTMRVGKYLTKCIKDGRVELSENAQRDLVTQISADNGEHVLKIARTEEEIQDVYTRGPHSCMSSTNENLHTQGLTPCVIYATEDMGVGYIESSDGRIVARSVLNIKDKHHVTIYGDDVRMEHALEDAGYTRGNLEGCRMLKKEHEGGTLMPYLDWGGVADHDKDYWVITREDEEFEANDTTGYLDSPGRTVQCEDCDSHVHEDEILYINRGDYHVCENCRDDHYIYVQSRWGGEYYHNEDMEGVHEVDGDYVDEGWLDQQGYVYVESEDKYVHGDECVNDYFTDEPILAENAIEFRERDEDGDIQPETYFTDDEDRLHDDTVEIPRYEVV